MEEAVNALEEQYASELDKEVESINENLVTKIDEYLEYVVTEWMEENKLAIEKGIKAELVEDFMVGLKNLFTEHYVDIPEDKVNVVEEYASTVDSLQEELDKIIGEKKSLADELNGLKKIQIVREISEELSEGNEFVSVEDYTEKLNLIKKKYFTESKDTKESVKKNESLDSDAASLDESYSPIMSHYVDNISKFVKR